MSFLNYERQDQTPPHDTRWSWVAVRFMRLTKIRKHWDQTLRTPNPDRQENCNNAANGKHVILKNAQIALRETKNRKWEKKQEQKQYKGRKNTRVNP